MVIIMNKKFWITFIIIGILIGILVWLFFSNNSSTYRYYEASRTSYQDSNKDNNFENSHNSDISENTNESKEPNQEELEKNKGKDLIASETPPITTEEQISTFSTKIYSRDSARQNNISITCNTLNNTIVKNGETFSFCGTVGQATSSKGYEKADIFDNNGKKKKGLGGGNCQISTTLYNALLSVPTLVITERHEHSNYVPYISKGKDAAVAYGSYDLKFRNNSGNDIKILSSSDGESITVNLIALK